MNILVVFNGSWDFQSILSQDWCLLFAANDRLYISALLLVIVGSRKCCLEKTKTNQPNKKQTTKLSRSASLVSSSKWLLPKSSQLYSPPVLPCLWAERENHRGVKNCRNIKARVVSWTDFCKVTLKYLGSIDSCLKSDNF